LMPMQPQTSSDYVPDANISKHYFKC